MNLHFITLSLFLLFLVSCKKSPQDNQIVVPDQKEYYDISYANMSAAQKLDIVLPPAGSALYPVVIWIHGGGWQSGDKAQFRNTLMFRELNSRGYAVVSINYRLSGEAKFPAQIHDVKAAIRWLKANAINYAIDKDKIGLWGSSAGGHLCALAGTSAGVSALENLSMGNENIDSRVHAIVDWYGPTNFLFMDSMAFSQGCSSSNHNSPNSPESLLIGFQIATRPDLVAAADPATYITSDDPPFFIEHGLIDCTVAYGQSQYLYDKLLPVIGLQKLKIRFLSDTGHGGGLFSDNNVVKEAVDYFDIYLK